ncbi:hypothetical protein, partial [Streptomyces caniscabiei]|uniref:hypothetical protein n=1 Tax=Streptomyces caniscabiei TaxID=2746961 RepID=UPI0038F6CF47
CSSVISTHIGTICSISSAVAFRIVIVPVFIERLVAILIVVIVVSVLVVIVSVLILVIPILVLIILKRARFIRLVHISARQFADT